MLALGLGIAATVAVIGYLALSTTRPDFVPLYSGLDARSAGEIATRLDGMGIPYEVSGPSLLVPSTARDRARMALAADGLPRQGQAGYELLDGLNGFGVTAGLARSRRTESTSTASTTMRIVKSTAEMNSMKTRSGQTRSSSSRARRERARTAAEEAWVWA